MDFEKDKNRKDEWIREDSRSGEPFDFDAFLDSEDMSDRVTDALDGRDLLRDESLDDFAPDYIPTRRHSGGEHGRHEAPGSAPEEREEKMPPRRPPVRAVSPFDPKDPRYAAPERPKVVVTEPRKRVYVPPPGGDDYDEPPRQPPRQGMGEGAKWVIAGLVAVAILLGIILALFSGGSGSDKDAPSPSPSGGLGTSLLTDRPQETIPHIWDTPDANATPTPTPTEAPAASHTISVTCGAGGSVSPSGAVSVQHGSNAAFVIIPDGGYEISQVLVDGESVKVGMEYTFKNVTTDHTIYVVFRETATPTPPPTPTPTPTPTAPPAAVEPEPTEEPVSEAGG